jgi:hypothetical protein
LEFGVRTRHPVIRRGLSAAFVAAAVVFGAGGLAACGNDDGADVRDLTEETAIPSGSAD